jgi:hypothetical protein
MNAGRRWSWFPLAVVLLASPLTTPAHALGRDQVLLILGRDVLHPSGAADYAAVRMVPHAVASGVLAPRGGGAPNVTIESVSGHAQWVAFVDSLPCDPFMHGALYVLIDDVTGAVTTFPAQDWPTIDAVQLGVASEVGERLIRVVPMVGKPFVPSAAPAATGPLADYGDAPDGEIAYAGNVMGRFPTRFATANGVGGRPGGHATTIGAEMLGRTVSGESDVTDPADPDGRPNRIDGDADDRMFIVWDPNTDPPTANLIYDCTVAAAAPAGDRYVNALVDLDRDGHWGGGAGVEWTIVNQPVAISPGTTATFLSPSFAWTASESLAVWARVSVTHDAIPPADFGVAGWDGSGALGSGEVEDFLVAVTACQAESVDVDESVAGALVSTRGPDTFRTARGRAASPCRAGPAHNEWSKDPEERKIGYRALLVQGMDNPKESAARQTADVWEKSLKMQGYVVQRLNTPTRPEIADAIQALIDAKPKCEDNFILCFVGHSGGAVDRVILRDEQEPGEKPNTRWAIYSSQLAPMIDPLKPCDVQGENCGTRTRSCDVTVIVDACGSGGWIPKIEKHGRRILTACADNECSHYDSHDIWPSWLYRNQSYYSQAYQKAIGTGGRYKDAKQVHLAAAPNVKTSTPQGSFDACSCTPPGHQAGIHPMPSPTPLGPAIVSTVAIHVADHFPVAGMQLLLDASPSDPAGLAISLISPTGVRARMVDHPAVTDFRSTVFDDYAQASLSQGPDDLWGDVRPLEPLAAFNGLDAYGDWTIEFLSDAPADSGTVYAADLEFDLPTGAQWLAGALEVDASPHLARLRWALSPDGLTSVTGVQVERADPAGAWEAITPSPLLPTTLMTFDDASAEPGHAYRYRLAVLTRDGAASYSDPVRVQMPGALETALSAPIVPRSGPVEFRFATAPVLGRYRLDVLDIAGRRVRSLGQGSVEAGEHRLVWDRRDESGRAVSRGVYMVQLEVNGRRLTRKFGLLKGAF